MKILITGATGYLGGYLTKRLLQEGHKLYIIVRSERSLTKHLFNKSISVLNFEGDMQKVTSLVASASPDLVIHLATFYGADNDENKVENIIKSNITYGTTIIEGMIKSGCRLFINTGTYFQHYYEGTDSPV